jgi:hypothetical protein
VNALFGAGSAKMPAQNIEPQRFRGQSLDFKELAGGVRRLHSTAFASTMMGLFSIRNKVRFHIEAGIACGKLDSSIRYWRRFQFWRVA